MNMEGICPRCFQVDSSTHEYIAFVKSYQGIKQNVSVTEIKHRLTLLLLILQLRNVAKEFSGAAIVAFKY